MGREVYVWMTIDGSEENGWWYAKTLPGVESMGGSQKGLVLLYMYAFMGLFRLFLFVYLWRLECIYCHWVDPGTLGSRYQKKLYTTEHVKHSKLVTSTRRLASI